MVVIQLQTHILSLVLFAPVRLTLFATSTSMESSADSPRRSSSDSSSSLEFEFWMVGKEPSIPQPHLLTADELFVDGVLLPLDLLPLSHRGPNSATTQLPSEPQPETPPPPPDSSTSPPPPTSSSKRWKDILKAGERKLAERVRKKGRRDTAGNAAELNINIWPFSRSRSAGNAGTGNWAKFMLARRRKASSTPCSRSNSRGESSKPSTIATAAATTRRRWAPNPGRVRFNGGIHLGRTSQVWQLRRNCKPPEPEEKTHGNDGRDAKKGGASGGVRMLDLNMNTCIRYRNPVSCSGEDKDGVAGGDRSTGSVRVGTKAGLFNLKAIFSKKAV